ncbi:MAG: hypothetical protein KTR29_10880 [Rhodothermaceae bacterium]|nr:hypothetical protein [Rhodothermaceae bacterium]
MTNTFDPRLDVGGFNLFKGEAAGIVVIDPITPNPPFVKNFVLDPSKPFDLKVSWELDGFLVPIWLSALDSSNWNVQVFAESVGPGDEKLIASISEPVGAITNPKTYDVTITVPANALAEGNPGQANVSGIYKLTACIFLNSSLGTPGYDIVGFAEGPTIKIENPV